MIVAWWASVACAGAWTKEVGELYTKVGADLYRPLTFVMPGDDEASTGTYLGQQYGLYAEVGVVPGYRAQLSISAPVVVGTVHTDFVDTRGTIPLRATTVRAGDLRVAAQIALHPRLPIAAAIQAKIPMYANGRVGEDYPTFSPLFPKPGDGQIDVTTWLYGGFSPTEGAFAELGLGWRHRTEVFVGWLTPIHLVDGVVFSARAGKAFGPVLPVLGIEGVVNPVQDTRSSQQATLSATALIDVAPGLAVEPRISGELWAKNASQGIGGGLGVSYRR